MNYGVVGKNAGRHVEREFLNNPRRRYDEVPSLLYVISARLFLYGKVTASCLAVFSEYIGLVVY